MNKLKHVQAFIIFLYKVVIVYINKMMTTFDLIILISTKLSNSMNVYKTKWKTREAVNSILCVYL